MKLMERMLLETLSPPLECRSWEVGSSTLFLRSAGDEWEIASRYDAAAELTEAGAGPPGCEDELVWTRYVTVSDDSLQIRPALPDRPVVVRPARPIVILPGRWGRFFFRVPLWTQFLSLAGGRGTVMEEIPSRRLTSIWFGSIAGGELCYAIEAPLQRAASELEVDESFAVCEVQVRNGSRERLRFERICVHVEHMRLFASGGQLWTNEVRVSFRGSDQVSQLSFEPGPPESVTGPVPVGEPRMPPESHLIKRSFALIREITGI